MDEVFLEQPCLNVPLVQDFSSIILRVVVMWMVVMIGRGRLVLRGWGRMVATTAKGLVRLTSAMILKHRSFTWSVSKEEGHPKWNVIVERVQTLLRIGHEKTTHDAVIQTWSTNFQFLRTVSLWTLFWKLKNCKKLDCFLFSFLFGYAFVAACKTPSQNKLCT